jgi:hypothetical protein
MSQGFCALLGGLRIKAAFSVIWTGHCHGYSYKALGGILCWALSLYGPLCLGATAEPMVAIFWNGDMTEGRVQHETQVIKLALEKSRTKYGDYAFRVNSTLLSNQRVERELREGQTINLTSSPIWMVNQSDDPPLIVIPVPIAHGLLGYRRCIVRKADLPRFAHIKTLEDLQKVTAGLVNTWTDVNIFEASGLAWHGGKTIEQLHSMLARSRFDYLPLGSIEVEQSLENSPYREQLAIVPNLIIYYPLPILVQVSVNQPLLAERLEYGLRKSQDDGSLDRLFDQHYGHVMEKLRSQKMRVIRLKNPNLPEFAEDPGPTVVRH